VVKGRDVYVGSELELFSQANHWKAYYGGLVHQYLVGEVLEVGAGIGATTRVLCDGTQQRWVCLEPDEALSARISKLLENDSLPPCCEVVTGRITALDPEKRFDAILYVDVLEHIEDDRQELVTAVACLRPGGTLIVLAPAHQWLYTPFDKKIGHYRRYTKRGLSACVPPALTCIDLRYLDSVGLVASLGNMALLRKEMPSQRQIAAWDNVMVPLSRVIDRILGYQLGKSILGIWRRNEGN
jgi:SAM-dependent methyltransferase